MSKSQNFWYILFFIIISKVRSYQLMQLNISAIIGALKFLKKREWYQKFVNFPTNISTHLSTISNSRYPQFQKEQKRHNKVHISSFDCNHCKQTKKTIIRRREITKLKYEKRNREGDIQIYNTIQITKSSSALSLSSCHHPTWIRLKWIPFPFINHTSKQFINWRLILHLNLIGHCCSHQWLEMAITLHKEIFNITKMIWDLLLEVVHTKDDSRLIISSKVMSMFNNINDD